MKKIITTLILFSILLFALIGVACVPDFKVDGQACADFSCVTENLPRHLAERSSFFFFLPIATFIFLSLAAFVDYQSGIKIDCELCFLHIRQKQRRSCAKLFDFIIELFSGGILRPKIFSQF